MEKNKLVIYAKGGKIKYYNIILSLFSLLAIGAAVVSFIESKISTGVIAVILLVFIGLVWLQFIRKKKVVFLNDHLEIPMEYIAQDVPFSKTIITYKDLKSVEFIKVQDVENDCVGSNGRKVPCIKFVDKEGEIYRMKLELFSENQAFMIINETRRRAGIVEEENALE